MPVGILMARAVRDYHERTGFKVGFKPAGGIRSAKDALAWYLFAAPFCAQHAFSLACAQFRRLSMMFEELGEEWTHPHLFRIGASSLLGDVERQLEHGLSGRYAAQYYMPMA